ncbi:MAG: DUF1801 domain-containing protein [Bacteroidetes bacterium]|nr:DUF1801 domain-containing protein [Bacteroidota bacterium]
MRKTAAPKDIDSYIAEQPEEVQPILEKLRQTIKKAAPKAEEVISYRMPAFKYHGILVYFAANKNHIGFYPTGSGIEAFKEELEEYAGGKGTAKFPIGKALPWKLIAQIVKYRVAQNLEKTKPKKSAK